MKIIYKSEIDGKLFDNKHDCLKHEFKLKDNDGDRKFRGIVNEAIEYLESTTDLNFELINAEVGLCEEYGEWNTLELNIYDGDILRGDLSRGFPEGCSKEDIIKTITHEYIIPYEDIIEGTVLPDGDFIGYGSGYYLGEVEFDLLLNGLNGKNIKIEVIK